MKKIIRPGILLVMCITMFLGCKDIYEEDISEETINLIAPSNNVETHITEQTFYWTEVTGATHYNIQIVTPSFSAIEKLIIDSNLTTNTFDLTLDKGDYEWSVLAYNHYSSVLSETYVLTIGSEVNLNTQDIELLSPNDNFSTKDTSIEFSWKELSYAEEYFFQIKEDNWADGNSYYFETTPLTSVTINLEDGTYVWGVQGKKDTAETAFSTRTLIIDNTAPAPPTLIQPAHTDTSKTSPVDLIWSRPADNGSTINDVLYIYDDIGLTNLINTINTADTSHNFAVQDSGDYYWYVISIDALGNRSDDSDVFQLNYKPEVVE